MDSEVFFNGRKVASHRLRLHGLRGGPHRARRDTDGRTPNVLAVKVRNQVPSSRWYSGSGIYRHVHLVVSEPACTSRATACSSRPRTRARLRRDRARVHVETQVAGGAR